MTSNQFQDLIKALHDCFSSSTKLDGAMNSAYLVDGLYAIAGAINNLATVLQGPSEEPVVLQKFSGSTAGRTPLPRPKKIGRPTLQNTNGNTG